jgi:hypothetical protein
MLLTKAPEPRQSERPPVAGKARTGWTRPAFLVCELAVLVLVVRELWRHAVAIRQHVGLPFQVDYEEGNILNALVRIAQGQTPYPDPHALPNILNPYGPVAYYLLAIPVKLFGISFLGPRLVIVACVAAVCCLIGLAIARVSGSRMAGVLFGSLYGALALVQGWSTILRVDLLTLAFSMAGVYCFVTALRSAGTDTEPEPLSIFDCRLPISKTHSDSAESDNRQPTIRNSLVFLASAVFFGAALLAKYTYAAAPAACMLWLITQHEWRQAARFAGIIAAICAVVLAIAALATRGAIFTHLFLTHADPFTWSVYLLRLTDVVARHRVLVALAGVQLISDLLRRRISLPALWLLLAAMTAVTAGKLGSNWNHFLELPAALCLCAGVGWTTLARIHPRAVAVTAALVATSWLALFVVQQRKLIYDPFVTVAECPQAYAYVKDHGADRVLSENVGALVMAGKTVWVSNPFVYSQMVMRAGWPDAGLERMLQDGDFNLFVAQWNYPDYPPFMSDGGERFSSGAVKAIVKNYRAVQTYQCTDARVIFERK